ncbi:hypothetical protein CYMTET_41627 [Cymbomonas tetramitiformis]|uniref:SET domain-containing protein n=1 Tax=Cymbomonas tetramitiformis TaxID=36881 RepID=A0AAE0C5T2_9CHLO|nr:hypothetical protein CYMTET_41627 [Cymbomonas tetramitiformis]
MVVCPEHQLEDDRVNSVIELRVDLPAVESVEDIYVVPSGSSALEVTVSDRYRLSLSLPRAVNFDLSRTKFRKKLGQLRISLPYLHTSSSEDSQAQLRGVPSPAYHEGRPVPAPAEPSKLRDLVCTPSTSSPLPSSPEWKRHLSDHNLTWIEIPGKGRGIVAECDLHAGQLLGEETAFTADDNPAGHRRLIQHVASSVLLGELDAGGWTAAPSKSENTSISDEDWNRASCIIRRNSFCKSSSGELCIFLRMSMYNHACEPNCFLDLNELTNVARMRALRDIPKGEECCINYQSHHMLLAAKFRQLLLQSNFGFTCHCARCSGADPRELLLHRHAEEARQVPARVIEVATKKASEEHQALVTPVLGPEGALQDLTFKRFKTAEETVQRTEAFWKAAQVLHIAHWQRNHVRNVRLRAMRDTGMHVPACMLLVEQMQVDEMLLPQYFPNKLRTWRLLHTTLQQLPSQLHMEVRRKVDSTPIAWDDLAQIESWDTTWAGSTVQEHRAMVAHVEAAERDLDMD